MPLEIVIRPSMESSFPIYIIFIRQPWYYNLTTERRDESSFSLLNFRYVLAGSRQQKSEKMEESLKEMTGARLPVQLLT